MRYECKEARTGIGELALLTAAEAEYAGVLPQFPRPGEVALQVGDPYDCAYVITGTPDELLAFLVRAAACVAAPQVRYVIEHRLGGGEWTVAWSASEVDVGDAAAIAGTTPPPGGEAGLGEYAQQVYDGIATAATRYPRMQYRLVRRTAITRDEVLGMTGGDPEAAPAAP